jgi:hypothetical protein
VTGLQGCWPVTLFAYFMFPYGVDLDCLQSIFRLRTSVGCLRI